MSTRYVWNRYTKTTSSTFDENGSMFEVDDIYSDYLQVATSFAVQNNKFIPAGTTAYINLIPGLIEDYPDRVQKVNPYHYVFSPSGDKMWNNNSKNESICWALLDLNRGGYTLTNNSGPMFEELINPRSVESQDSFLNKVSSLSSGSYPLNGSSGSYWYVYQGADTIDPSSVTYSTTSPEAGKSISIIATPRNSSFGGTTYYQFSYSINGGASWTNIGNRSTATSISITIPTGATQFQGRVLASDDWGFTSNTYVTGSNLTISQPIVYYTVSLFVDPSHGGSVSGSGTYSDGSLVTVKAIANTGYKFSHWERNNSSVSASSTYTFAISSNTSITAIFVAGSEETDKGKAYVGVSDKARNISNIYIGVNGKARKVIKGYVGVEGKARQFWPSANSGWIKVATLSSGISWRGIAYGNGIWVAVGAKDGGGCFIAYSTDTKNWVEKNISDRSPLRIFYCGGKFLISTATSTTSNILYSIDGINWSLSQAFPETNHFGKIAYGNGKYVSISTTQNNGISPKADTAFYSSNAIDWYSSRLPSEQFWSGVAFGDGIFVAIADSYDHCAYSTDGINWKLDLLGLPASSHWIDIAFGDITKRFVAISYRYNEKPIYSTSNMVWDFTQPLPDNNGAYAIYYGDGKYLASNASSDGRIFYSPNGYAWEETYSAPIYLVSTGLIAYGNGKFVALGLQGEICSIESSMIG